MTKPFSVRFTRWTKQAVREQSAQQVIGAENFADAYEKATLMRDGMNAADDNASYEIAVIQQDGLMGEWHTGTGGLWKSNPINS